MQNYSIQFLIATVYIQVIFEDKNMHNLFKKMLLEATDHKQNLDITFIIKCDKKKELKSPRFEKTQNGLFTLIVPQKLYSPNYVSFTLRVLISVLLMRKNIFFFHASSLHIKENAYIFCAPSGGGKSTVVTKVPLTQRLGDDTAIIVKQGNSFYCYTSPFDEAKMPGLQHHKKKLKKIFILNQSKQDNIKKLSRQSAYKYLLNNSCFYIYTFPSEAYFSKEARRAAGITDDISQYQKNALPKNILKFLYIRVAGLAQALPVYSLKFTEKCSFISSL